MTVDELIEWFGLCFQTQLITHLPSLSRKTICKCDKARCTEILCLDMFLLLTNPIWRHFTFPWVIVNLNCCSNYDMKQLQFVMNLNLSNLYYEHRFSKICNPTKWLVSWHQQKLVYPTLGWVSLAIATNSVI